MPSQENFDLSALEEDIMTVLDFHELYGLQIIKAIEEASGGKRRLGVGSVYPTLHRLEKKGFVTSKWGDDRPEERGGARKVLRNHSFRSQGTARHSSDSRQSCSVATNV
jgi:DNA-binding PadR family transcriptional regulator